MTLWDNLKITSVVVFTLLYASKCEAELNYTTFVQIWLRGFTAYTAQTISNKNIEEQLSDQNVAFSPIDLYKAFAIGLLGSGEEVRDSKWVHLLEIDLAKNTNNAFNARNMLEIDPKARKLEATSIVDFHKSASKILRTSYIARNSAMKSGTAMYVRNDYAIKDRYIEKANKFYDLPVKCVDFKNHTNTSTELINNFIANQTFQKISNFFDEPVPNTTKSVLTSSFVLVINWKKMFQPDDTYENMFRSLDEGSDNSDLIRVCTMMNQQIVQYYNSSEIMSIGIPTGSPDISVYFVLTKGKKALHMIYSIQLYEIILYSKPRKVLYHIPKFRIHSSLDVFDLFDFEQTTDFIQYDLAQNLTLSIFKQQVLIDVNEIGLGGCPVNDAKRAPSIQNNTDPNSIEFIVDRPFAFFVYNSRTKTFLLYGIIYRPRGYSNEDESY